MHPPVLLATFDNLHPVKQLVLPRDATGVDDSGAIGIVLICHKYVPLVPVVS